MMQRSPEEIAALRESFRKMDTAHKAEYIYMYYKWFILLGLIALVILGNTLHRQLTKKEPVLYLGLTNVSIGQELEDALTTRYLEDQGLNLKKFEVLVYSGLYLSSDPASEDHQYAYASRMKVMASVNAKKLDIVLMNRESYDLLSQSGYLLDLTGICEAAEPYLVENEVILEDNSIDFQLNEAEELRIVTETAVNGLDLHSLPLIQEAGFGETVYLGVLANCPRMDAVVSYLNFLLR